MPYYDLPKDELTAYAPELVWPVDADLFWLTTLADSRALT
jgi:cephalosporin-C deacetylase-like acetyl esterase